MVELQEVLIRSVALFFLVFGLVKLMGKKHPAKMNPFFFMIYTVVAAIAALTAVKVIEGFASGLLALALWGFLAIGADYLSTRSKILHDLIHGKETILIKQGKIMEENLGTVRFTAEELLKGLRQKDIFNVADVEFAVLETTGDLNVLLKSEKKPITPRDMEWKVLPQREPQTVILDGNIVYEGLTQRGLNHRWLEEELERGGIALENVFVGQVDSSGELYLDLFDDAVQVPQPKVRELLYAVLEKSQGELTAYAAQVEEEAVKHMYEANGGKLKGALEKLRPYLLR